MANAGRPVQLARIHGDEGMGAGRGSKAMVPHHTGEIGSSQVGKRLLVPKSGQQ